jgi:hypothetical protein
VITIGSLFSGIGGLELGLELCGLGPVIWQCERAPFARAVLEDRYPGVRIYRDVRDIDARATRPDLICGGFPCQDVSVAGAGAGLEGDRSGLWWEFRRIVRVLRPALVFVENVHAGWRRWLPIVRRSLWRIGYACVPLRVRAADVGAPHERARIFVLAYADGEQLRQFEQRLPGGRPGRVRDAGKAEPRGDGEGGVAHPGVERLEERAIRGRPQQPAFAGGGTVADGDGAGLPALGLAEQAGVGGAAGLVAHGRYAPGWQFPPGPAGIHAWNGPQPAVRRASDGLSRWVGKAELEALGNAVVPFAAARAWRELTAIALGEGRAA